jgi:cytochrome c-type biogenesis protein
MLENIFIFLTEILSKSWYLALTGSFFWGILSVVLSPCHLGSIPLIVAFINEQGKITYKKAFLISFFFSLGILISITVIGVITGLTGRILGNIGFMGFLLVAFIFFIVGLHFIGLIPMPNFFNLSQPDIKRKGLISGFLLGLMFGLALGPCTFAFMAPILAVAFSAALTNLTFSIAIIFLYAVGHCLVFIFFGTFGELVQKFLNWDEKSKGTIIIKKFIGVIIILIGIYIIISNIKFS